MEALEFIHELAETGHVRVTSPAQMPARIDAGIAELDRMQLNPGGRASLDPLPSPGIRMASTAPTEALRVAIAMEQGVAVITPSVRQSIIYRDLVRPVIGFTRAGLLIVVTPDKLRIGQLADDGVHTVLETRAPAPRVVAVLPTHLHQYALFEANGTVTIYHVPSRLSQPAAIPALRR